MDVVTARATDLRAAYAAAALSPVEVHDALSAHIEATEPGHRSGPWTAYR